MGGDGIRSSVREEAALAGTARGRWHAEYLGLAYRGAIEKGLALAARPPAAVLKTDLWNECLGGERDILGHLRTVRGCRLFGVDCSLPVCATGRGMVPGALVVQADITALPFRAESFDAVLDLSTLDHVAEAGMPRAIGEYRRVLRGGGVLLVVFWQRTLLMRLRLACKRLAGLREKRDQRYFPRRRVRAAVGDSFAVADEFPAGLLLLAPFRLTGLLTAGIPAERLARFLRWVVRIEQTCRVRRLFLPLAGLCGFATVRCREVAGDSRSGPGVLGRGAAGQG